MNGFPLAVALSAANVNDHLLLPTLLDRVRPLRVCGRAGRARRRITTLIADKGYDYPSVYSELRQRRITGYIARRGTCDKVTAGPLDRRTIFCPAAPVPSAGHSMGTTHRHPSRIPRPHCSDGAH